MSNYSDITIHHPFSSSVQKEKYLLSYNGQYYEASHAIVELVEELQRYEAKIMLRFITRTCPIADLIPFKTGCAQ